MGIETTHEIRAVACQEVRQANRGRVPMGTQETITLTPGEQATTCSPFVCVDQLIYHATIRARFLIASDEG